MGLDGEAEAHFRTFHFDGTLLKLSHEEEAFFKVEIGIQDLEELRKHITDVHEEAYKVSTPLLMRNLAATTYSVFRSTHSLAFVGFGPR